MDSFMVSSACKKLSRLNLSRIVSNMVRFCINKRQHMYPKRFKTS